MKLKSLTTVLPVALLLCVIPLTAPAQTSSPSVGDRVQAATSDVKEKIAETGKATANTIEALWQSIDEARLKNRTRDELVAWVIMGLLVGGLLSRVSKLKTLTAFLFGLIGSFIGGMVAHVGQLDFGLGPVLVRYEDLLCSLLGGALLLLLAWWIASRKTAKP